jgi:putative heme-binding domain-containing protein
MRRVAVLVVGLTAAAGTLVPVYDRGHVIAQDHGYTSADIDNGARLYQSACSGCHGSAGGEIPGVELGRGQFRRGTSDTDLIAIIKTGIPGTAMPPHSFSDQEAAQLVGYLRNMTMVRTGIGTAVVRGVGDPARGQAIFEGKGQCTTCHRVYGRGPRLAPDLTEIGLTRPLPELRDALLDPSATMRPGNRPFRLVTADGRTVTGRLLNQDSFSIQMLDSDERLVSVQKRNVREHGFITTSPMPTYKDTLTVQEVDDLIGYLVSLKGFNP